MGSTGLKLIKKLNKKLIIKRNKLRDINILI